MVFYTRGAGGCNADLPIRSRPFIQLNGLVVLVLVVLMRVMLPCLHAFGLYNSGLGKLGSRAAVGRDGSVASQNCVYICVRKRQRAGAFARKEERPF